MSGSTSTSPSVLRISTVHGLPDVLRELGQSPSQVIDDLGFEPTLFDHSDNRITLAERGRLLECCAKASACPHFGLLVGQKDGLDQLGIVGLLARHAPDVGTALRRLIRHFHLQAQGVEIGLAVEGGRAIFSYTIADESVAGIDQVGDGAVAAQLNIMRELCGPDFKALAAWFVRSPPNALEPYRNFFQVHLRFDAPIYGLEFSSSWLARRLPSKDEALAQLIAEKLSAMENQKAEDLSEKVRRLMQTALAFNHVGAQNIASMIGIHVRTYHRRLRVEGTSHQELLDKTRMALASRLLENSSKDIAEISELLGYAEPRSFIRAFKRWTATTPARWRRDQTI
jgi:AraC-like DNA-binding protein